MIDSGDDTDLIGIADDVKDMVNGNEGLIVIYCKPFQHPTLMPVTPLGAPAGPNLAGGLTQPT